MDTLLFAGIKSAWFQISWILNHNVLGLPLSDDEKLYLLETTVDEWEDLSEKERDEVYARECWKKDALTQWRADFRKKKEVLSGALRRILLGQRRNKMRARGWR